MHMGSISESLCAAAAAATGIRTFHNTLPHADLHTRVPELLRLLQVADLVVLQHIVLREHLHGCIGFRRSKTLAALL